MTLRRQNLLQFLRVLLRSWAPTGPQTAAKSTKRCQNWGHQTELGDHGISLRTSCQDHLNFLIMIRCTCGCTYIYIYMRVCVWLKIMIVQPFGSVTPNFVLDPSLICTGKSSKIQGDHCSCCVTSPRRFQLDRNSCSCYLNFQ